MTNQEKYKTAKERAVAFNEFCLKHGNSEQECPLIKHEFEFPSTRVCIAYWLEMEVSDDNDVKPIEDGIKKEDHKNG